jgi:hypothetical protein
MKKILLFLTIIAVSITSCSTDEPIGNKPETTSIYFNLAQGNLTGKSIERGSIPLYVDNLKIKATSRALSPYVATEEFTFTGLVTTVLPALSLDNVALGLNTFSASSTSSNANKVLALVASTATNLDLLKSKTPYIPCYSYDDPTPEIIKGANPPVTLKMKSNYGRILSLFKVSDGASNYVINIKTYIGTSSTLVSNVQITPTTIERNATFEWSDVDAVSGAKVKFVIEIRESGSNKILHTFEKELQIQREKSLSCIYVIGTNDVKENLEAGKIIITFPVINEINCETIYDNDGYNCHGNDNTGHNRAFDDCGWHKAPNVFYNSLQDKNLLDGDRKCN